LSVEIDCINIAYHHDQAASKRVLLGRFPCYSTSLSPSASYFVLQIISVLPLTLKE
jgi:hypothetical protein